MANATHSSSAPARTPHAQKNRVRWRLFFAVGIPTIGITCHAVWYRLFGEAVAIGDTAHPVLSPLHGVALSILNFPMMYLWFPIGEWLKPHLTDDGVISLFAKINALFWGILVTWALSFIIQRSRRRKL